jgi:hypothetical protein
MVQFDENNKLCIAGIKVKWLKKIIIKAWTEKQAEKKAFEYLNQKYPEYKNYIQLM